VILPASALARGGAIAACALLSGCASRAVIVDATPLWPFYELTMELPSTGTTTGYLSRPEGATDRFVVIVQEPLCTAADRIANGRSIGTAGLLWSEFKSDATFLQFTRPGVRAAAASHEKSACRTRRRESPGQLWRRAVSEATAAVRKNEDLPSTPTVYVGITDGALPAWGAAVSDANAGALVLINATLSNESEMLRLMQRLDARLRITIIHVDQADRAPLERALDLFATLQSKHQPASMLLFEGVGNDFGLTTDESRCFERAIEMLGEQVREPARPMTPNTPTVVDCKETAVENEREQTEDRPLKIERVERQGSR